MGAVEQTRGELQQLSARLLDVEEEGRRKLSRELHDEIGQTLALLQIEISHALAAIPAPRRRRAERLERARELAERTVQTIRNISGCCGRHCSTIWAWCRRCNSNWKISCAAAALPANSSRKAWPISCRTPCKTCVYRVVQEALHNCEKHSGASQVRVAVRQLPDCLVAEIEDNGRGFSMNEQGMPYRATGWGCWACASARPRPAARW